MMTTVIFSDAIVELLKAGVDEVKMLGDGAIAMRPKSSITTIVSRLVKDHRVRLLACLADPDWWDEIINAWDERLSICLSDDDICTQQAHEVAAAEALSLMNAPKQVDSVQVVKDAFGGNAKLMPEPDSLQRQQYGGQPHLLRPALYEYWKRWRDGDCRDTDPLHLCIEDGSGEAYAWKRIKLLPEGWMCPYSAHPDEAQAWMKRHIGSYKKWHEQNSQN